MSCNISLIVSSDTSVQVPAEVPHFLRRGLLYVPLAINGIEIAHFIERMHATGAYCFSAHAESFEWVRLLIGLKLHSCVVFHSTEHGDIPVDTYELTAIGDAINRNSILNTDNVIGGEHAKRFWEHYEDNCPEKLLGFEVDTWEFKDYASCVAIYNRERLV